MSHPVNVPAARAATIPRNAGPRYLMLADSLVADIERGKYKVGDMLPPELVLAAEHGVSRYTAREAIRRLTEMGLISRRAGIGTTVLSTMTQSRYTASISDIADLVHFTKRTQLKILTEGWVKVEGDLALVLPTAVGQRWYKFSTLRYPGTKTPISYTDIVVHPSYERIRERIYEPNATVYRLIEDLNGERISEVRQEISCLSISPEVSALLGVPAGSPALLVLRYYLVAPGTLVSVSINTYPQDRFKLSTRWRLDWAPPEAKPARRSTTKA